MSDHKIMLDPNNREDDYPNAFEKLILNEGQYSNDPVDPGGKTIYGITERDYPKDFRIVYDLWKSGKKNLALRYVYDFYYREFWNDLYKEIPDSSLAFKIFDLSVNRSKRTAIKLLQKTIYYDFKKTIKIDGAFGLITLGAIKSIPDQEKLYNKYLDWNHVSYSKLRTAWKYLNGWINRLKRREFV